MELNKIYIGSIFSIIIFIGLFTFLFDGITQYQPTAIPTAYNESYTRISATLDDINETTSAIQDQLSSVTVQSGVLDYLGFFFNAGYKALSSGIGLVGTFFVFVDESLYVLGGAGLGSVLKVALYSSIIVLFFIGIIIHAFVNSDRV